MLRRFPCLSFVAITTMIALAGCGGAIEQPGDGTAPAPASTLASSTGQIAPLGTWELMSLDRSGRSVPMTVHDVLQMDLRADGSVTVRRCGKTYYEPGSVSLRCADAASYDCFYGRVLPDGDSWRIDVPDLPTATHEDKGLISYEDEGIKVLYITPTSEAGHFIRVPDGETKAWTSSSAVGNCKGK